MTLQRSCHARITFFLAGLAWVSSSAEPARSDSAAHDYPTYARVEYVNECVVKGGKLANLYQCSCAIDRIAKSMTYDDFVEASTFVRYSNLPGEGGALFRETDRARSMAKRYRGLETDAWSACGLQPPS
jgi:hypothetical protein